MEQGFVQVYTGNGKGKTTAALGLGMRAVGHGLKVIMFQFLKGSVDYGELRAAELLGSAFKIVPCGRECFVKKGAPSEIDVRMAQKGIEAAKAALRGEGNYDIVILDEINCAVDFGLLTVEDVLEAVRQRRKGIEVVLTGRAAHARLIEEADLVTEMLEVKHYYRSGIDGRVGIER